METITIPLGEYHWLKGLALKIGQIEEVIHEPELSEETKKRLAEARATPLDMYIKDEEIEEEFA